MLELQRLAGNRAVAGLLSVQREGADDDDPYADEPKAPPPSVTGYLGLNPAAGKEAAVLKGTSKERVLVSLNNPDAEMKLRDDPAIFELMDELGIDPGTNFRQWDLATDILLDADPHIREQLADVMRWFSQAEKGEITLDRLVLSGHSNGVELWGDAETSAESKPGSMLVERDLGKLVQAFPKAAAEVKDVMFSACFSINAVEIVIRMFPSLENCWSYSAYSPNVAGGSGQHIAAFARATEGESGLQKSDKRGSSALWTKEKGYIVGDPAQAAVGPLFTECVTRYLDLAQPMVEGTKDTPKPLLDDYYPKLQQLLAHPGASASMKAKAAAARDIVLRLRYWHVVREKFGQAYGSELQPAYDELGVPPPAWAALTRVGLKAHVDALDKAIEAHPEAAAAKETVVRLVTSGLRNLDTKVIPASWL